MSATPSASPELAPPGGPHFDAWIARLHAPELVLDSREQHMPMSYHEMVEGGCQLTRQGRLVVPANALKLGIMHMMPDNGRDLALRVPQSLWLGADRTNLRRVPYYVKVQDVTATADGSRGKRVYHLKYCFNYPYNGRIPVCHCCWAGHHQGDLEHATVEVEMPSTGEAVTAVRRVFMSQHGGGQWYPSHQVQFADRERSRCVLYVALHSHALHRRAGWHLRFLGAVVERYNGLGERWRPDDDRVIIIDEERTPWITYAGAMGEPSHGNMPFYHRWWAAEQE